LQIQTSFPIRIWLISMLMVPLLGCHSTEMESVPELSKSKPYDNVSPHWWTPDPDQSIHIQYEGEIDLSVNADIFNLDLFETTPEEIQTLHRRNIKVICYLNAGAWENWRSDREAFPQEILGKKYQGWPGEYWLDIRQIDALESIMGARLDLCVEKGFDGVEPDNMDGYQNQTGFPLKYEDQLKYNRWFAEEAHKRNLAIGLKNDPDQAEELVTAFDWITTESCFEENWCEKVIPFILAEKPVFAIEYTSEREQVNRYCETPLAENVTLLLKKRSLDAWQETCP